MLKIGCHLSSSKGYLSMGKEAVKIGANTFQFFTRNPRGGPVKPLDPEDIAACTVEGAVQAMNSILSAHRRSPHALIITAADRR